MDKIIFAINLGLLSLGLTVCTSVFAEQDPIEQQYLNVQQNVVLMIKRHAKLGMRAVWQQDASAWRAHMQALACDTNEDNSRRLFNTQLAGYATYKSALIENFTPLAPESTDEQQLLLDKIQADILYLSYRVLSSGYSNAYVKRVHILFNYHPEFKADYCQQAQEMAEQTQEVFPNPVLQQLQGGDVSHSDALSRIWREIGLNYHYSAAAYYQAKTGKARFDDAQIYAFLLKDKVAYRSISQANAHKIDYQAYQRALLGLAQADNKMAKEPINISFSPITSMTLKLNESIYPMSTFSALNFVLEQHDNVKDTINTHMQAYVSESVELLDQSKSAESMAF
ncbi:hypothetical protein [Aliiglaciecola sp. LCG003]|uniref:hypothetical protein n=1 Tax=Aliiglaciecola sp. LCG003 TaxID=3053655 RepID=UPI002573806B|nr:hypothetical protein [Aliiglaciecola sp. LCG003]WJG09000.1 hypothetical protein QR722_16970 [Aliiglaciecola sp. LCG003]